VRYILRLGWKRTSEPKPHQQADACQCPFESDVRNRTPGAGGRTSDSGHWAMLDAVISSPLGSAISAILFGYLCGSIPFGVILTRLAGTQDIRSVGSGNIGATNVLRTGHKALAAATLLGDMLKGTAAVLLMHYFFNRNLALAAGLGAFLGHLFPVWLRFKGGKGVATYIGILLGLA